MTMEKKDKLVKAGKCFYCEQNRHLVKDCLKKKGKQKEEPPKYEESTSVVEAQLARSHVCWAGYFWGSAWLELGSRQLAHWLSPAVS